MLSFRKVYDAFIPKDSTHDSVRIILNTQDPKEQDALTERWRSHKLEELNFIGIVVSGSSPPVYFSLSKRSPSMQGALLAGCLTSTGDWPNVLSNGRSQPWTVTTCWYAGIVCALFCVLTVALQSMRLHRLCAHRDGLKRIREVLGHPLPDKYGRYRPRRFRVYAWQVGPMLLLASVLCMTIGMGIMLWVGASLGPLKHDYENWWDNSAKVSF